MKYYGIQNGREHGFYLEPFDGAVEVEDAVWEDLLGQCAKGKVLKPDENGYPTAVDHVLSTEEAAREVRSRRNSLLAESDWTQLQDADLTEQEREKWQMYRQALRDITSQSGFPQEVAWPAL